ncbi:MAG: hypothetical protein IKB04_05160 [Clostridia bacterium]|nr:hypothetical protein [Clostridia bacterium]
MAYLNVLCPACAGMIQLHEAMKTAYCPLCGDCISLEDAKNERIDAAVLESYPADVLYTLAQEADNNATLMHAAAKKGSPKANLFIGTGLVVDGEYRKALPYLKVAANAKVPEGMALYGATMLDLDNDPDEYEEILTLLEGALKLGCEESVADICNSRLEKLRPVIANNRRVKQMDAEYRRALNRNDYEALKQLAKQGHAGARELVDSVEESLICCYYQNGLCTKQTTSYYVAHCDDPRKVWCSDYRKRG